MILTTTAASFRSVSPP